MKVDVEQIRHIARLCQLPHEAKVGVDWDGCASDLYQEAARVEALDWRPIDTLGFGVEEHIVVATDGGFYWVVDCDKDINGEWLRKGSEKAKDREHIGVITHYRLLGELPPMPNAPLKEARDGD